MFTSVSALSLVVAFHSSLAVVTGTDGWLGLVAAVTMLVKIKKLDSSTGAFRFAIFVVDQVLVARHAAALGPR